MDCKNLGELCNIAIPVENGLFSDSEENIMITNNTSTNNNGTDGCESKSVFWSLQGAQRATVSVQLLNSRQVATFVWAFIYNVVKSSDC